MLPIALPVLFITSNTVANAVAKGSELTSVTGFLGNPNFALLLSAAISLYLLASQKGYTLAQLAKPVETALASGGLIILITAAGGSFGGMLVKAEVGKSIGDLSQELGVGILLLSFLLGKPAKGGSGFRHRRHDYGLVDHGAARYFHSAALPHRVRRLCHRLRFARRVLDE